MATPRQMLTLQPRDWVLVADFENKTGDPLLDDTLQFALTRELNQWGNVKVASRDRVNDALRLMRQRPESRLTSQLAREVCLRDGGLRAFVTGRIERIGLVLVLTAQIVEPEAGVSVATISEEARQPSDVLGAVRRLSLSVRRVLGGTLPNLRQAAPRLEKVMTPSLHALQLYSKASKLVWSNNAAAIELLQQTVAEDPEFASAYNLFALIVNDQNRPPEDYLPYAQRAFELADTTGDAERLFIRATYHRLNGRPAEAIAAYKALAAIQPDHWGAIDFLMLFVEEGRLGEASQYVRQYADARPTNLRANARVVWIQDIFRGDAAAASPYLRRALQLLPQETTDMWGASWLRLLAAFEVWQTGDAAGALSRVESESRIDSLDSPIPSPSEALYNPSGPPAMMAGLWYLTLGRLKTAESLFDDIPTSPDSPREFLLTLLSLAREDPAATRVHVLGWLAGSHFAGGGVLGVLLARHGSPAQIAQMDRVLQDRPRQLAAMRGELARLHGRPKEAIPLLEQAAPGVFTYAYFFLVHESLAAAWEDAGDPDAAAAVLERVSPYRSRVYSLRHFGPADAYLWMRTQMRLADLYRKVGRVDEARALESELLKLLAVADADHPMLRAIEHLRAHDFPR
jgi:tetratricopeptide (TPR) repeat protein